jgi:hypothetical protein
VNRFSVSIHFARLGKIRDRQVFPEGSACRRERNAVNAETRIAEGCGGKCAPRAMNICDGITTVNMRQGLVTC